VLCGNLNVRQAMSQQLFVLHGHENITWYLGASLRLAPALLVQHIQYRELEKTGIRQPKNSGLKDQLNNSENVFNGPLSRTIRQVVVMVTLCNRADHYIFAVISIFYLSSFFLI